MKIREISLRELMKYIIPHWKRICIAMLISAMVMTVFVFFDNWFINNAVMEEYYTALNGDEKEQRTYYEEKIRELLEEAEAKEVETLVSYENSKKIYEKNGNFFDDTDYIKCLSDVKILMDYISQMIQYNKYIPETKGLMTEEQGYYYEYLTDGTMHWDLLTPEQEPVDRWLDIVAIALLVGFVYIFILVLRYISDGNLRNYDNINELFGVPQLGGMISCDGAWADDGKVLDRAIFDITFMASRANTEKVVLTGSVVDNRVEAVMKDLKHALNEKAVHCDIAEDIINDITAVQHFANADGVVLVETVGKSNCQGIVDEMELAAKYDTKVLGVVKLGEVL